MKDIQGINVEAVDAQTGSQIFNSANFVDVEPDKERVEFVRQRLLRQDT